MRVYRELFGLPGVPRLVTAAALSRLTTSMMSLSIALTVSQLRGSLADAGLVLVAHAAAIAACAPFSARLADRFGPRVVLASLLFAHAAAYSGLILALREHAPTALIGLTAMALGATTPPSSAVIRNHWASTVPADRLRAAYAFDSALNSTTFIAGPPVAGLLASAISPLLAMVVAAGFKIAGDTVLLTTPGFGKGRRRLGSRLKWGPLANGQVRLLLTITALETFIFGCLDIGAVAAGKGNGVSSGLLMGLLSAGSIVGGLVYGARTWPGQPRSQLVVLHLAAAAVLAVTAATSLGALTALPLVGLLYTAAGVVGGTSETLDQVILTDTAPAEERTESFAWLNTFMWVGFGVGAWSAGHVHTSFGPWAAYGAAAAAALLAAAGARMLRLAPTLTPTG